MKIAVIGCGVMGGAFARHFAAKHSVILCDRNGDKTKILAKEIGGSYQKDLGKAVKEADCIFLAIKPKDFAKAAQEISTHTKSGKILISILAGVSLASLQNSFPQLNVIRAMPNLGFTCHQGVIGLVDEPTLPAEVKKKIDGLLVGLGLNVWLNENKIEALSALSGSGIGFVFVMIEAMLEGGVLLGLTAVESREVVLQTFLGAVALMAETGKHPAELKLQVCSPGGTTISGLKAMEEAGVRAGILATLVACYEKASKLI